MDSAVIGTVKTESTEKIITQHVNGNSNTVKVNEIDTADTMKEETIDTIKAKTIDTTKADPMDATKAEPIDTTKEETIDMTKEETKEETIDTTKEETIDTTKEETIDTTKEETIDTTKEETIDTTKEETIDTTKEETIDTTKEVTIDTTKEETIDIKMEVSPVKTSTTLVSEGSLRKINNQMEYYFGNYNLNRDLFLIEQTKKDDGWVPMTTMLNFKRLASLSTDTDTILKAIEKSNLLEIDESHTKVRRSLLNPLPQLNGDIDLKAETRKRTVYVKGFPKDGSVNLDILLEYFKGHGPFETIYMRNYTDQIKKTTGFKGSILVVFPERADAEAFLQKFDVKFNSTPLLRMWHDDYLEEKTQEYEARRKIKEEKKQAYAEGVPSSKFIMPKGAYLHMSNIPAGTMREDIKAALIEYTTDFAFIGFHKEQVEGYLRFKTEGCNVNMLSQLQGKLKIKDTEITLRIVEGEEEEQQIKMAAEAQANSRNRLPGKRNFRSTGSFRGPSNKRRRMR